MNYHLRRPPCPSVPLIAHVPHSTTLIPSDVRAGILLGDEDLHQELNRLTDWHTDELFDWVLGLGGTMFVNAASRLVVDPERFPDDEDEVMAQVGHGAVYMRTTQGLPMRESNALMRSDLMSRFFEPYAEAVSQLVDETLGNYGRCLILDCHSFPTMPLPCDIDQSAERPDICVGTDSVHTPSQLADRLEVGFARLGLRVTRDAPFAGSYVPLKHYGRDRRVLAIMVEVRRGLYCDEATGERSQDFGTTRAVLEEAVGSALGEWLG